VAIDRLHDDPAHPGGKPDDRPVVRNAAVRIYEGERRLVGHCRPLEYQVAGFLVDQYCRAVIALGRWVDTCEE